MYKIFRCEYICQYHRFQIKLGIIQFNQLVNLFSMFIYKQQFQMSRACSNPSKSIPLIPNHQKKQSVFERLAYSLRKINKSCRLTLGCQHISKLSDGNGQKMINNLIHPYIKQVFTSKNIQQSKLRKKGKATFNVLNRIRSWHHFPSVLEQKNLIKPSNPELIKKQVKTNCEFHSVSLNKNSTQKQQKIVNKPIVKQALTINHRCTREIEKKRIKKIQNEGNREEKQKKVNKNTGSTNQLTSNSQKNVKRKQKNKTDSNSTDHNINTDQKKSQINLNTSEMNKQRMQTSIHIDNSITLKKQNQKQNKQLQAIPTSLSIQPNQNPHYLHNKSLGIHKIVEVTIDNHEKIPSPQQKQREIEIKVIEQNNQLSKELQKYRNQCKVLQDQLRQTLITVKHISIQLQAANKTQNQQQLPNNLQIKPTLVIQPQYQAQHTNIIRVGFENNTFTTISGTNVSQGNSNTPAIVNNSTYAPAAIVSSYASYPKITSQINNPSYIQPLPNANIATQSHTTNSHIIKTISPTVISTNSSKVIKLGRDRTYCTKGCTSLCDCLMTSAPLTYYPS